MKKITQIIMMLCLTLLGVVSYLPIEAEASTQSNIGIIIEKDEKEVTIPPKSDINTGNQSDLNGDSKGPVKNLSGKLPSTGMPADYYLTVVGILIVVIGSLSVQKSKTSESEEIL